MNIDKIRADALAAACIDHNESPHWYSAVGIMNEGAHYSKNAIHIANCDPRTILSLLAVVEAAREAAYPAGENSIIQAENKADTLAKLRRSLAALEAP